MPGPWLEPGFRKKGYEDFGKNSGVVVQLIDRFNVMLEGLASSPQFGHVHYLDLRGTLRRDGGYSAIGPTSSIPPATGSGSSPRSLHS